MTTQLRWCMRRILTTHHYTTQLSTHTWEENHPANLFVDCGELVSGKLLFCSTKYNPLTSSTSSHPSSTATSDASQLFWGAGGMQVKGGMVDGSVPKGIDKSRHTKQVALSGLKVSLLSASASMTQEVSLSNSPRMSHFQTQISKSPVRVGLNIIWGGRFCRPWVLLAVQRASFFGPLYCQIYLLT